MTIILKENCCSACSARPCLLCNAQATPPGFVYSVESSGQGINLFLKFHNLEDHICKMIFKFFAFLFVYLFLTGFLKERCEIMHQEY